MGTMLKNYSRRVYFVAFNAIVSQRFLEDNKEGTRLPLHWFRSYRGVKAVLAAGWPWIQDTFIRDPIQLPTQPSDILPQREDDQFSFLLSGLDSEKGLDAATLEAYELSVAYLSQLRSRTMLRHFLGFLTMVPPRFVELLATQDPRILTIVGYYFMLLKTNDQMWWIQDVVTREFKAVMTFLPEKWWSRMDWAAREFSGIEVRELNGQGRGLADCEWWCMPCNGETA